MRVHSLEKAVEQKVGAGLRPRGAGGTNALVWDLPVTGALWLAQSQARGHVGPCCYGEHWEMEGLVFLLQAKENDELTRICDDLISKMEKI